MCGSLSPPRLNIFIVGNMGVMICLSQGGLRSLSASSLFFHFLLQHTPQSNQYAVTSQIGSNSMTYFCINHDKTLSRSILFLATKLQIFILCSNDSRQFIGGWVTCQILHLPNWQVVVKSHLPTEILACIGRLAGASASA